MTAIVEDQSAHRGDTTPAVVVSADTHVGPLLKEQMRDYCPKKYLAVYDEWVETALTAASWDDLTDPEVSNARPQTPEELRSSPARNALTDGGWDPHARLRDMDDDGVAAEVVFHSLNAGRCEPMPFGGNFHAGELDLDPELVGVGRHMYNQWLADFCSVEPERHAGLAHLPMWDVDAAVKEMEWAREAGLRGINFPRPRPGLLPYNHPDWDPFWSAAEALGMPLTSHAQHEGTSQDPAKVGGKDKTLLSMVHSNLMISVLEICGPATRKSLHHLVFGGVFDRHPGLKLVFTEQPGLWWHDTLEAMDSMYVAYGQGVLGRLPSEYAHDHLYVGATCMAPFEADDACREGYVDNVLWGTDYPHVEGSYQYPRYDGEPSMSKLAMRDAFSAIPREQTAKMIGENACNVYGFDLGHLRTVAERIGAPTYAELATPLEGEPEDPSTRAALICFRRHSAFH